MRNSSLEGVQYSEVVRSICGLESAAIRECGGGMLPKNMT